MDDTLKMSFYDKTRVVVLDLGYKYTKVGISGEGNPRFILPSVTTTDSRLQQLPIFYADNPGELYDNVANFLHFIFYKRLLINPRETKVVIVESLLCPTIIRRTLAKVLFSHLDVMAAVFVPCQMVTLYTLAASCAIAVDLGFIETCVMPVYHGYPILHAYQTAPVGSKAIENEIRRLLVKYYSEHDPSQVPVVESLPDETIEGIKVTLCFVAPIEKVNRDEKETSRPPDVMYPITDGFSLRVPGCVREDACEVLFTPDIDGVCLPTMILDAILKCSVDMRKSLSESLLLFGGTAMLKGLRSRLSSELLKSSASPYYSKKLIIDGIKLFSPPSRENCTAWLGGSILGATDTLLTRATTKEEYNKSHDIPDWANLKYNLKKDEASRRVFSTRLL